MGTEKATRVNWRVCGLQDVYCAVGLDRDCERLGELAYKNRRAAVFRANKVC